MRNSTSVKTALGLLIVLLIVAGCSSKGVISGRVLVPRSSDTATSRTPSDSSVTNTVIFIAGDQRIEVPAPGLHSEVTQTDDGFHPHILPVTQGTEVEFRNQGEVYHNAFSVSPVTKFDVGTYAPGETRSVILDQLGIINVFCELHPASAGFIVVVPDQYHAQPDATGAFSLPGLPGGMYTVKVWHPIFGELSQEVVLSGKQDVQLELEY